MELELKPYLQLILNLQPHTCCVTISPFIGTRNGMDFSLNEELLLSCCPANISPGSLQENLQYPEFQIDLKEFIKYPQVESIGNLFETVTKCESAELLLSTMLRFDRQTKYNGNLRNLWLDNETIYVVPHTDHPLLELVEVASSIEQSFYVNVDGNLVVGFTDHANVNVRVVATKYSVERVSRQDNI